MKIPIILLAVLALVCGKPLLQTGSIKHEVKEFIAHFPTDKVLEIALDYLANDKEVREFVAYVQSDEYPKIHKTVEQLQEYKDCFNYFNDQGVDVYAIVNQIHDTMGYPPYQPTNTTRKGVGFYGLIDDVFAVLPLDHLTPFMGKKMESREFFKTLGTAIHSPALKNMVDNVQSWPEYNELREILQNMVSEVQRIVELAWEAYMRETQSLQEDLKEFMALLPAERVLEITLDYLANDPEFNEAYAYVQSEEFPRIHKIVEYLKQYKDCFNFINDQGVDVHAIFNKIHDTLGYPPFQPTNTTRSGVGFNGLKNDVIAALPLDDLKALYYEKTETREYFKTLVRALKSPVLKALKNMVNSVQAWPEYQKLLEIVQEYGADRDRITKYLWEQSLQGTRRLQHKVKQFMAHFRTDRILEIAMDYLSNDKEVREFVAYIQSEEFPKIHKTVEQLQKYKECFNYFNKQGVDVYAIVNQIHNTLGYPPYQPTNTTRTGVGFYGLIDDVIAVLPLEDLTPFKGKKMESRQFFKTLGTAVNFPALKNMVKSVQTWPEYQEIQEILQNMSVEVQRIIELVWEIILRETSSLQGEVKEFMALVPTKRVLEITLDYVANDPEFNEAYSYVQSEEFPRIHRIVEYLKEYKDCFSFINDQGVDVQAIFSKIHDTLGYPPYQPTNTTRTGVGYCGLKDDVIAALPLDDLRNLYHDQIETKEYYKTLVRALKSPALKNMVETVRAQPEYQKLLETLRQMVDRIIEYFKEQFGSYFPYNRKSEQGKED